MFTSPLNTAAPTVLNASTVIITMYFAFAPATSSKPIISATSTDDVPRSGCRMINTVGTPPSHSAPTNRS